MTIARALARTVANASYRVARLFGPRIYAQDGLISVHNHDFMRDPAFLDAYARGRQALYGQPDYRWHWRIHTGLWAARTAATVEGDFVECGVNRGFLSSAIMHHIDWDTLGKTFWLLDTFAGLDERYVSQRERDRGAIDWNREKLDDGFYVSSPQSVIDNFSQWKNVRIIVGTVPETLGQVTAERIAYLHLDMNCAPPEVAAIEYFWSRLAPGATVLFDDYAYVGFEAQKVALDAFARAHRVPILSLPTGQGLLIKPPG
ncbi:MAG TPA: TylF/MycF/NovP-related O-methyltransferase [Casimicrobiaceae bacterium]|nr:TylF/MycF/NovP-related O-methyltransferase [Casimicrobiaceae bacterium]